MVQDATFSPVTLTADARNGKIYSGSGSVSTSVVSVTIPVGCNYVKIYPTTLPIRFAIDEDPATVGTLAALAVGGIAKNDQWEVRSFPDSARTVRLLGTAATTVDIEFF